MSLLHFIFLCPPGCDRWFPHPGLENSSGTNSFKAGSDNPLKLVMLFDVEADPEERGEVSDQHVVDNLLSRLGHYLQPFFQVLHGQPKQIII